MLSTDLELSNCSENIHPSQPLNTLSQSHAYSTGASGSGRTTFVNTLIDQPLLPHRSASLHQDPSDLHSKLDPNAIADAAARAHEEDPIRIKQHNVELEEDGARIALTIVDTPGFGEGIDNEHW